MKLYNKSSLWVKGCLMVGALLFFSCEDDSVVSYDTDAPTYQTHADPYLQVVTGFLKFEPGTPSYDLEFNLINGRESISQIRLYKTFTDAGTGKSSAEVLVGTYNITSPLRTVIDESLTYADLRSGITIDGGSLPANDEDIVPGSGWSFRFEGTRSTGEIVEMDGAINMVFSKYAGIYEVIESKYVRSTAEFGDEDFGDWNGTEVFIGFVDVDELSYNDRWGYFAWSGSSFNISYDPDTNEITDVPVITVGLFSGDSRITCVSNAAKFAAIDTALGFSACDVSNVIIDNDVTGEHEIHLTYGYVASSGPRQFYEVLKKKI